MTPEAVSRILEIIPSDKVKEEYFKRVEEKVSNMREELCPMLDSLCKALNERQGTFTFDVTSRLEDPRKLVVYMSVKNNFSVPDQKNLVMFESSERTGGELHSNVHGVIFIRERTTPLDQFVEEKIKEATVKMLVVKQPGYLTI